MRDFKKGDSSNKVEKSTVKRRGKGASSPQVNGKKKLTASIASKKAVQKAAAQKTVKKGATRKSSKIEIDWSHFISITRIALIALLLIAVGSYGIVSIPALLDRYPITQINLTGNFHYVDKGELKKLAQPFLKYNYFTIDLGELKEGAEGLPWSEKVAVTKSWPGTVDIHVTERVAIAIWNQQELISHKGELFKPNNIEQHQQLPLLQGPEDQARFVMEQFERFSQLLRPLQLNIRSLSLEPRMSWSIQLTNDMEIFVDRANSFEKLVQFTELYQQLKEKAPNIERVDLRYRNGLAIKWYEKEKEGES